MRATITGGTHNPLAPSFDFLDRVFVPQLRAMGADVTLTLHRHGFAPGGGGKLERRGRHRRAAADRARSRRPIVARKVTVLTALLPTHVAEREFEIVRDRLDITEHEHVEVKRGGPANVLVDRGRARGSCREVVTGHGEKGLRAELVAERACDEMQRYLAADAPVGEHLADQLLLPLAVAGGGRFRAAEPLSLHATTNIDTIRRFIDVPIVIDGGVVSVG